MPSVARYPLAGSNRMVVGLLSIIASVQIVPVIGTFASLFLLLAFAVVHLALQSFAPPAAATAWRLLMASVLPLVAMSLAIDEQVRRAINPVFWVEVLLRIGLPYLGAAAMVWIGLGLGLSGAGWLDRMLPPFFGTMVSMALALWVLFMAAHFCGRLVFQYRDVLGFSPEGPEEPERLRLNRDYRLEDEVGALLAHGRQWLHQRVLENDARGALALLQECLELDPALTLPDPADWDPLIEAAERAGLPRLAEAARAARAAAQSGI
ncbi:MAG: hypothetical protein KatS3mg127_0776 [Silanimonas sp.]|nr:MAG: hypothetical protein KatS3mg127_0776 [Silanimonas sp.]